jgi:secondary thiamine-phosphate synthase enzyme
MILQVEIPVKTLQRCHWVDITGHVQKFVNDNSVISGICTIVSLHTTASVTINENADPDVQNDFFRKLSEMVPVEPYFLHGEGNSDSHIKASLVGLSVQVAVNNAKLVLGTWQSIYFCEFDGPRKRRVSVTVIGE